MSMKRFWQCNGCYSGFEEGEWRGLDTVRQLPKCEVCGAENWEVVGLKCCPEGSLYIGEGCEV